MQTSICDEFRKNPWVDPVTKEPISLTRREELIRLCRTSPVVARMEMPRKPMPEPALSPIQSPVQPRPRNPFFDPRQEMRYQLAELEDLSGYPNDSEEEEETEIVPNSAWEPMPEPPIRTPGAQVPPLSPTWEPMPEPPIMTPDPQAPTIPPQKAILAPQAPTLAPPIEEITTPKEDWYLYDPEPPSSVTIIGRHHYVVERLAIQTLKITPYGIFVDSSLSPKKNTKNNLSIEVDAGGVVQLEGNWMISGLNPFPDGQPGGIVTRLTDREFPVIRIGSMWQEEIIYPPPIHYPPVEIGPDRYIVQEDPLPEEFQFFAMDYNSDFFQASIATSRLLYPSLETWIQAAEALDVYAELRDRSSYGSYLQHASYFEINRIYKGPRVERARKFIQSMMYAGLYGDNAYYEIQIDPFPTQTTRALHQFMDQRGYTLSYIGYISRDHPAVQAYRNQIPLTPDTFLAAITPEQSILMEAWRKRILLGNASTSSNVNLLGFQSIRAKAGRVTFPQIKEIGFSISELKKAITAQELAGFNTVNDIRYPKEVACDIIGFDISTKRLPRVNRKAYYMMLYHEAIQRGKAVSLE